MKEQYSEMPVGEERFVNQQVGESISQWNLSIQLPSRYLFLKKINCPAALPVKQLSQRSDKQDTVCVTLFVGPCVHVFPMIHPSFCLQRTGDRARLISLTTHGGAQAGKTDTVQDINSS